ERTVLKFAKINKIRTISTQDQKPQRKAGSGSSFSLNNLTLKFNLSKILSSGTSSAQKSKPDPSKVNDKSPGTNFIKITRGIEVAKLPKFKVKKGDQKLGDQNCQMPKLQSKSIEEENVVHREEEEVDLDDISQVQDVVLREKLCSITRLISNIESLKDNSTPDHVFYSFESDNSLLDNFSPEFETFCDHSEETRSEPPDDNFDLEPEVISAVIEDIDEPDEHFNPGGEIFVSTNNEDVDYFVIRIFLPYLILPEISPLFLFAESEDTIFDPGLSPED
nr:hypothetical protein [Tanacetum cinerariifolium]